MDKNISETLTKLENKDNSMQTLNSLAIIKTSNVNKNFRSGKVSKSKHYEYKYLCKTWTKLRNQDTKLQNILAPTVIEKLACSCSLFFLSVESLMC